MLKQQQRQKSQKSIHTVSKLKQISQNTISPTDNRIKSINTMILQQKSQIEKNIKRITSSLLNQRKYKKHRKQLQQRIKLFDHYHKHILNQFFGMIANQEIISLTTQNDLLQKIEKLKKSIFTILNRIHLNLDCQQNQQISSVLNGNSQEKNDDDNRRNAEQQKSEKEIRERSRGKNTKINNESVLQMTLWLLKNFQNPYPTLEEKSQMAKKSGLSLVQVNNWFINARERVIKKYQCKQPHIM